jgi:hypothetical protein
MKVCGNFLLLVALAAMAATTALGQDAAPAVGPARPSGIEGAAFVPDFSGIWGHPFLTGGLEPPLSGSGPVTNRSRRNGVSSIYEFVGDYTNPILQPWAAEVVKKHGEISRTGVTYPTPGNQCWPEPLPFIFRNLGMTLLQQSHQITILYSDNHEVRRVRLDQPHAAPLTPSWYGDSVGHYEGDTLVIDTVGVKIGPFAMVDFYGTPYTQALHVVERYRLLDYEAAKEGLERDARENLRPARGADAGSAPDYSYRGKHLQLRFTVEDEGVFTMPWSATITYRRGIEAWREVVCAENTGELALAGRAAAVPAAHKPDF